MPAVWQLRMPSSAGAEGARHRAEAVVDGFHPVDADADVGQADLLQGVRHLGGDQGAVGGDHGAHALGHGVGGQVGQVLAHEGLPAGKQHDGHAEPGQVVDQRLALRKRQLVRLGLLLRVGIAVHAPQVAPAGHVPDDDRLLVRRELQQVRRQPGGVAPVAQGVRRLDGAAVEFRYSDHGFRIPA